MPNKITGIKLQANKGMSDFESENDSKLGDDLREAIGCQRFEVFNIDKYTSLWFDEDFLAKQESMMEDWGHIPITSYKDIIKIMGNVVILGGVSSTGKTLSLDRKNLINIVDYMKFEKLVPN